MMFKVIETMTMIIINVGSMIKFKDHANDNNNKNNVIKKNNEDENE